MRYIQSRSEQMRVVQACHVDVTSGHFGVTKTVTRIKREVYVEGHPEGCEEHGTFFSFDLLLIDARSV